MFFVNTIGSTLINDNNDNGQKDEANIMGWTKFLINCVLTEKLFSLSEKKKDKCTIVKR